MIVAACCAAAAVWCVIDPGPRRRCQRLTASAAPPVRRIRPELVAAMMLPMLGFGLFGVLGLLIGAAVAPVGYRLVVRLEPASRRRERLAIADQLPLAVDLLAAAMAAGVPVRRAIEVVAAAVASPIGPQLEELARRLLVGDVETLWRHHADGPLAPLARALLRAERHGIGVVSVLEDSARDLRAERQATRRESARRVGVRTAAPLGLCFLPAFFLVGIVPMLVGAFTSIGW